MVAFLVLAQRISHGGLNDTCNSMMGWEEGGGTALRCACFALFIALTATPKEMHISIFEKILLRSF